MKDTLTLAYMQDLNIIKEDQDLEQNVDDLTEENTTTIEEAEEETSINNTEECEESVDGEDDESDEGWNDEVTELCDELTYQFDGFAYELKNCVRGSFTDANTPDELANYLENLKSSIDSVINQLRDM
jgi:hypothetical protein